MWDEVARNTNGDAGRLKNLIAFVHMFRDAMTAAQGQGPDALNDTRAQVRQCLQVFEAMTMEGFEPSIVPPRAVAVADLTKEMSELLAAITRFAAEPTPANQARAEDEAADVAMVSSDFAQLLARDAWRAPMSA